jgi:four helix bundle protein
MNSERKSTDLKERILHFVLTIIELVRKLPNNRINGIIISQIVRSSSSIGSNYEEGDGSPSSKDFLYKMSIVKKEAKETKYWLKLIQLTNEQKFHDEIDVISQENEELIRIFASIIIKSNSRNL